MATTTAAKTPMVTEAEAKAPFVFPTLTELKRAIPAHCFESSTPRSMLFAVRALGLAAGLAYGLAWARATPVVQTHAALDAALCLAYVWVQGVNFWGLFTIGHDCGHGSFSRYQLLNFAIGTLTHSLILTPYEAWKLSHRLHHKNTGNIDQDEIFYPQRKNDESFLSRILVMLLGGAWFVYEAMGFPPRTDAHTELRDTLFLRHIVTGVLSAVGVLAAVVAACGLTFHLGVATMGLYYWAPLFVFASMLVITTFLHHNDEETPWYADSEWTYVKGNLSSVDRDYGWLVNHLGHNIGTHQVHHLFPIIPHYKLLEATEHFRRAFPHLVRVSQEPIISTFWRIGLMYAEYGTVDVDAKIFTLKKGRELATAAATATASGSPGKTKSA